MTGKISIILGGDVMLGRLVKEAILQFGSDYPLGKIAPVMRNADLTIVNLECAISSSEQEWSGPPKAFYFGAPPAAADSLVDAGVDLVSLANNHALDFDFKGLSDTFNYLRQKNIHWTGAGSNLTEAFASAILQCKDIKFGMIAFCDHQEDFSAQANRPGIAYLDLNNETTVLKELTNGLRTMGDVDYPILSLHWGPNMVHRPGPYFVKIAHAAIDMGYKILFGHSAHVFHGVEIYKGYPIFYATGDLVDDYAVDYAFRNDHQLLYKLIFSDKKLQEICLYPVFIENCQTRFAKGKEFDFIAERAKVLCGEMGTKVEQIDHQLIIKI